MATKAIDAPRKTSSGLLTKQRRIRKIFGNIHEVSEMPNLIEVQRESYEQFLRSRPQDGYVSGLEKTLRSVFPIRDFAGTALLVTHDAIDAPVGVGAVSADQVGEFFQCHRRKVAPALWRGNDPATARTSCT